ncbi:MAG TPA: GAF domain-containing protein [Candidatus Sulfotelmatobacter sp.]|nr:GAF domain-containing protein [Candidatus Sulfotelmatobacter sp.]
MEFGAGNLEQNQTTRSPQGSISAALAAVRAEALTSPMRFPAEDGGHSLAEMAQRDLDAALQLLADRAQYITGASGAAIALRRTGLNDMLCRASAGTNAPELGALLSAEFGLSGESVRTRRLLRCDDAEHDQRVNREVCRELGIASVVVMPVVHDDEVLGVFELFSGEANAFSDRDLSAVQRLTEMVETAVKLAHAAENLPELKAQSNAVAEGVGQEVKAAGVSRVSADEPATVDAAGSPKARHQTEAPEPAASPEVRLAPESIAPLAPSAKKLFWSAALQAESTAHPVETEDHRVPPVLRGLRKCEACGFPITAGRVLCVECEEKRWRGQLKPSAPRTTALAPMAVAPATELKKAAEKSAPEKTSMSAEPHPNAQNEMVAEASPEPQFRAADSSPILSGGLQPSESWIGAHKYVIGGLLLAAAGAAIMALLLR